ncbi:hypothetical protein [Yoonia sp.]|uniref:hypothetical protein n=1 Tax=Yoonia sp. TaxID=2212373 RepID=UPI0019FA9DEE|nr:hypothetical protein [Yoonia sp.]MBE0413642.1 hypothetical protein [Yoonia sp.]
MYIERLLRERSRDTGCRLAGATSMKSDSNYQQAQHETGAKVDLFPSVDEIVDRLSKKTNVA